MNAAYVPDVVDIEGMEGNTLKLVRQEFGGQVSSHVRCDISSGAVHYDSSGRIQSAEGASAGGTVVDKSAAAGTLTARRRYLETIEPEDGRCGYHQVSGSGFDRPRH